MLIGQGAEYLEIEEMERVPDHLPTPGDVRVTVTLRLQDFSGTYSQVWLARRDLVEFVDQLRVLVETRTSTAKLEAMDPDGFCLELRPYDSQGHYEASVRLGRHQFSGATSWPTRLSGGFEIGSDLNPILTAFEALLAPRDAS